MNSKKIILSRIIKLTALILPAVLLVMLMPVNDFGDAPRIQNYYLEEPDSLDVVVLGTSEDYAGFSPVLAYEEYGFTSYLYAFSANAFSLFKAQLDEALRVQSPELVIVDVAEIVHPTGGEHDTILRQFLAGIPYSEHKLALMREYADRDDLLSYIFPFCVNHGKATPQAFWSYLQENRAVRNRGYSLLKGVVTFTGSGETWDGPYVPPLDLDGDTSTAEISDAIAQDLQGVLDACAAYPETEFLFVNYPHRLTVEAQYAEFQQINMVGRIIEDAGYRFVNLESMRGAVGIVPETDFYNNYHLNLYGQYKVTRFLCEYLMEEYDLNIRPQSPENRQNWDNCVEFQHAYYQLFDTEFKARDPEEFGLWLQENAWLLSRMEEHLPENS